MIHLYKIGFQRTASSYRLDYYNTPWDNERELEDIKLIFEGKDLKNNDLPAYKTVNWENLELGVWEAQIEMRFVPNKDGKSYDQLFFLLSLNKKDSKDVNS